MQQVLTLCTQMSLAIFLAAVLLATHTLACIWIACVKSAAAAAAANPADVDECLLGTDTCDQASSQCINTAESYFCSCAPGYVDAGGGSCVSCGDFIGLAAVPGLGAKYQCASSWALSVCYGN